MEIMLMEFEMYVYMVHRIRDILNNGNVIWCSKEKYLSECVEDSRI